MDVVTGGVAASQCQNRCRESTGPQNTILLSRWVTGRHWCPRQFQVRSLCYIHNHLGTLAKLQNTHLLSLGILSLLCAFVVKLLRNVTSRSIYNVEKGAQIELLLCFWLLWGEACVAILLRNWVENSDIYMWQQYDTASCIRGVTSVVCLCPMSRFLLSQKKNFQCSTQRQSKKISNNEDADLYKRLRRTDVCYVFCSFSLISIKRCVVGYLRL